MVTTALSDPIFLLRSAGLRGGHIHEILEILSNQVRVFETVDATVQGVAGRISGCVVIDCACCGRSPAALVRLFHRAGVVLPIIVVLDEGDTRQVARTIRQGAFDVVPNYQQHEQLLERVRAALVYSRRNRAALRRSNDFITAFSQLKPREMQVLRLLACGHSSKEIARRLRLSYRTIEPYRISVLKRFGATSAQHLFGMLLSEPPFIRDLVTNRQGGSARVGARSITHPAG